MEVYTLLAYHRHIFASQERGELPPVIEAKKHIVPVDSSVSSTSTAKISCDTGSESFAKADRTLAQQNKVADIKSADLRDNLTAIGLLVADALKDSGWGQVDRDSIKVEDASGAGGSMTYKISAAGATPTAVGLHSRDSSLCPKSEERTRAAAQIFGENGLSPRRIAEGIDWFIDPWEGFGQPIWATVADMKVLGKELAKVHKLPIDWYTPFKAQLKEEFPFYAKVPDSSHIWWYSCRTLVLVTNHAAKEPEWLREYVQPMFTPQTKAAARIVTCHGDLHAGNMISLAKGCPMQPGSVRFVDLEFSHVTAACYDLSYVAFHFEDMPLKDKGIPRDDVGAMRRAFLASYLEAMEQPSTDEDVDALLIDITLAACGHHFGLFKPWSCELTALTKFKQLAEQLLSSQDEQKRFRERGPEGWFADKGYDKCSSCQDKDLLPHFKFLDRIVSSSRA